jgi:hypothetical protein
VLQIAIFTDSSLDRFGKASKIWSQVVKFPPMCARMTILVATSVVRGSQQGESHGGVFLIDLEHNDVRQAIDWNTADIDWQGRGWDRGLRGIEFDGERIYIAASDELFAFDRSFRKLASYRSRYLKHCHEISRYKRRLYLTSTGFDALLGFDLDARAFCWGLHIGADGDDFRAAAFDPASERGPLPGNELHLNNVRALEQGLYISGLRSNGLLKFDGRQVRRVVTLPTGVHNAQPFRDGVLFNDSEADVVRYVSRDSELAFRVPRYRADKLTHTDLGDPRVARQSFGRGLCVINDNLIAAGSSPSTIALHDLATAATTAVLTLSYDIRNAIHGLEVWPFDG